MILGLLKVILGVLAVLGAFGFIIFIHELGHFLTARAVGIRCPFFAIGFGPVLASIRHKGTEFSIRLFPFGGYVLMTGEEPEALGEETWSSQVHRWLEGVSLPATPEELRAYLADQDGQDDPSYLEVEEHLQFLKEGSYENLKQVEGNFNHCTVPQRMLVISGGVLMNFAATFIILVTVGLTAGLGDIWQDARPRVSMVVPGSPAEASGLQDGDRILSVDGKRLLSGTELVETFRPLGGQATPLVYQRWGEEPREILITPEWGVGGVTFAEGREGPVVRTAPERLADWKVGSRVISVGSSEISSLDELRDAVMTQLEGLPEDQEFELQAVTSEGPAKIKAPVDRLYPRGQIGIGLGLLPSIKMESRGTSRVVAVKPGSPAEKAGFRAGDHLFQMNGLMVAGNMLHSGATVAEEALAVLNERQEPGMVDFEVLRNGKLEELEPVEVPASFAEFGLEFQPLSAGVILWAPVEWIQHFITMPVVIFSRWMQSLIPTEVIVKGLQGPLGIMHVLYSLSDNGWAQFLFFVGLLNAAVGGFNLIPFPALDGARLLILLLTALRGKEFDPEKEAKIHYAGLLMLLTLVLFISVMDVRRMFSGVTLIE